MIEYVKNVNMWQEYLDPNYMYAFTTNGAVKNNGDLVMGVGTALHVATMHPMIPKILGDMVISYGNSPYLLPYNLISFPTKKHWKDEHADEELIAESVLGLVDNIIEQLLGSKSTFIKVKMPLPGAGAGKLSVDKAKDILEEALGWCDSWLSNRYLLEVHYYE